MNAFEALKIVSENGNLAARPVSWRDYNGMAICYYPKKDGVSRCGWYTIPSSNSGWMANSWLPVPGDLFGEWETIDFKDQK